MTVEELIEELRQLPPTAMVFSRPIDTGDEFIGQQDILGVEYECGAVFIDIDWPQETEDDS